MTGCGTERYADWFFDLDGTLVDSAPDILRLLGGVLREEGLAVPELDKGRIGPLLEDIIRGICPDLAPADLERIVRIYRARYRACPFDESPAFPGIPLLFERLSGWGCRLFVATNKPEDVTRRLLDVRGLLPFLAGFACSDSLPGRRLSKAGMLALLMERHGVECTLEARDATYGSLKMIERWSFTHRDAGDLNSEAARWRKAMEDGMTMSPLADYRGEPLYKIVYIAEHSEDLDEAKRLYEDRFVFCESKLDGLDGGYVNGELINRRFDKGRGIKAVCDYLGVPLQDSIGFGDSDNDLQMTDVVGISVCMANGSASLKQRCDRIAPSVYEDGIAKEFAALGLI